MVLIYRSILATFILAVLLCGAYPLVVTAIGHVFFPAEVNGGLITLQNGRVVGAKLIGQGFSRPEYFQGRPSAAGKNGYDAANSSGSNLGPTNRKLYDAVKGNVETYLKENPGVKPGQVPVDAVTSSASGLDPHISPINAFDQVDRVARARHVSPDEIRKLVNRHLEGPQLGLFGEPVVNVLLLNLDLDHSYPIRPKGSGHSAARRK